MKLYLSSFQFGDTPQKLAELFGSNTHIAMIPNARDFYDKTKSQQRIDEEKAELEHTGLIPEVLDLRDYFGHTERLSEDIAKFGGLWVMGGNSFILIKAMRQSGFDKWIHERLGDKNFVYAGYSAGICILAPSLKGIEIVDNPFQVPALYEKEIIWDGLGVVDYSLAPHYRSDHPESAAVEYTVKYFEENSMPYKALRDGEVIISQS